MRRPLISCICLVLSLSALAGCGGSNSSSASATATTPPTPDQSAVAGIIIRDTAALKRQSFTPDRHLVGSLHDGTPIYIFHSVCTGSADGHCQAVSVFRRSASTPLWQRQYVGVHAIAAIPNGFAVTAVNYASGDPLCCPSLPDVRDTFTWNGSRFLEHGPLPHQPGQ